MQDESAWSGRTFIWKAGLQMFSESPIVGKGFGVSEHLVSEYSGQSFYSAKRLHNAYLKSLAELGIIGFSLFFAIMIQACREFYIQSKKMKILGNDILSFLIFSIFVEFLATGFLAIFGWSAYLDKTFWVYVGLSFTISKLISLEITKIQTDEYFK